MNVKETIFRYLYATVTLFIIWFYPEFSRPFVFIGACLFGLASIIMIGLCIANHRSITFLTDSGISSWELFSISTIVFWLVVLIVTNDVSEYVFGFCVLAAGYLIFNVLNYFLIQERGPKQ